MSDMMAFSSNLAFMSLSSIGVEVIHDTKEHLEKAVLAALESNVKIVIYDYELEDFVLSIMEKYDDKMYPIFLKLPSGQADEDTLKELKTMIEKSIGISII